MLKFSSSAEAPQVLACPSALTAQKYLACPWSVLGVVKCCLSALSLGEMCPNTEFFLVRIFLHSDSVFSPNAGKYGPENTQYLDTFHAVFECPSVLLVLFK